MTNQLITSVLLFCLTPLLVVIAEAGDAKGLRQDFDKHLRPLLETNCVACHRSDKAKGNLDLGSILRDPLAPAQRQLWRHISEMVHAREMPPVKESQQLNDSERAQIISWTVSLRQLATPDPGYVPPRRLTRHEYDLTISELFGVDLRPAADFPPDDVSEGFDNQGDALGVSPLLMEKYLTAVDTILDKAIIIGRLEIIRSGMELSGIIDGKVVPPENERGSRKTTQAAEFYTQFSAPYAGRHQVKIYLGSDPVANELAMVAVKIDGVAIGEIKVAARAQRPAAYSLSAKLEEGPHRLTLNYINPLQKETPAEAKVKKTNDKKKPGDKIEATSAAIERTLVIESVEIQGPTAPTMTDIQKRLMFVRPSKGLSPIDAAKQIIESFANRAFRRPVTTSEMNLLMRIFTLADKNGEVFDASIKLTFKAILLSSQFLFRIEQDRVGIPVDAYGAALLSDYEIASRLSYFLWSTMPDDELFELASKGRLRNPAVLEQQVKRMLADQRSRAFTSDFAGQWLQVRGVFGIQPDEKQFVDFDQSLRQALFDETVYFFDHVLREDRPLSELITANYSFLNERSASFYGVSGITGPQLRQVSLNDENRGGILGMAAILAVTSNPTRTSPVKRGKWVLEQLLDRNPAPPPADVPPLDAQPQTSKSGALLSQRQRMERHRSDPACSGCHATMDNIGYGLETFDPVGRLRNTDNGIPIDASGRVAEQDFNGPRGLKAVLSQRMNEVECGLVRKMLVYALGRGLIDADEAVVDQIIERSNHRLSSLITGIVTSYPFLYRRPNSRSTK